MSEPPSKRTEELQREVDERIDDLMREGEEMEKRIDEAESDAADVEEPDPERPSGGELRPSDLAKEDDD
jgi:hypothetical protein